MFEASIPCERHRPARRVHHPHLPQLSLLVSLKEPIEHRRRSQPLRQQVQPARAEGGVGEGLGGHGPHVSAGPRDDRPDRQELGLRGHADLAGIRIGRHDGEGHVYRIRGSRKAYRTSTTRFANTMNSAASTVTPITAGKSFV